MKEINEPKKSVLTEKMDIGTAGFDDFQAILLKKSRERSENQKRKIDLLTLRYKMEDYVRLNNDEVRTAGEFLKTIMKTLNIQQNKLAGYIGVKPSNFNKLLKGERPFSYELAFILGKLFNLDPILWIEIQAKNELNRLEHFKIERYSELSINELIKN